MVTRNAFSLDGFESEQLGHVGRREQEQQISWLASLLANDSAFVFALLDESNMVLPSLRRTNWVSVKDDGKRHHGEEFAFFLVRMLVASVDGNGVRRHLNRRRHVGV